MNRVDTLLPRTRCRTTCCFNSKYTARESGRTVKNRFDVIHFSKNERDGNPRRLLATRRVATFQNSDVMQREVDRFTGSKQSCDTLNRQHMAWMIRLRAPQEDIGVSEDAHLPRSP